MDVWEEEGVKGRVRLVDGWEEEGAPKISSSLFFLALCFQGDYSVHDEVLMTKVLAINLAEKL